VAVAVVRGLLNESSAHHEGFRFQAAMNIASRILFHHQKAPVIAFPDIVHRHNPGMIPE
jgi:hypothetical protein